MENHTQPQPVPNGSEPFRTVPQAAESFGTVPHAAEIFRAVPNAAARSDQHTLTVREVARMFEAAGVARTERSIVNWCQPNRQGIARLDAFFDLNERRWFITAQSVELAIQEELARSAKTAELVPHANEANSAAEDQIRDQPAAPENPSIEVKSLRQEIIDLKILNGGKDFFIEQLRKEREGLLEQLVDSSRKLGELETRLLQLESPVGYVANGGPKQLGVNLSPELN